MTRLPPAASTRRRAWALCLVVVWLALQTLGWVHGVAHGLHGPAGHTSSDDGWGHAPGSAACDQLDQWVHAQPPTLSWATAVAVVPPIGSSESWAVLDLAPATAERPEARAPPHA